MFIAIINLLLLNHFVDKGLLAFFGYGTLKQNNNKLRVLRDLSLRSVPLYHCFINNCFS